MERSGVHRACGERMGNVVRRNCPVLAWSGWKVGAGERGEIQRVIDGLGPGIVRLELQVVGKAAGQRDRTRVIDRSTASAVVGEGLKLRLPTDQRIVSRIGFQDRAE